MKIGIVIVSHQEIGSQLLKATDSILGDHPGFVAVGIQPNDASDSSGLKIKEAIQEVDQGHGVLILSDLFGASPSNICLPYLKKGKVEMVSGVNLPMLLKLLNFKEAITLEELADFIVDYGQRHIVKGSQLI